MDQLERIERLTRAEAELEMAEAIRASSIDSALVYCLALRAKGLSPSAPLTACQGYQVSQFIKAQTQDTQNTALLDTFNTEITLTRKIVEKSAATPVVLPAGSKYSSEVSDRSLFAA